MATCRSLAGSIGLVLLLGSVACGEMLTINASDMGWYASKSGDGGHHTSTNLNYLVGRYTYSGVTEEYHNFFVFDLTHVGGDLTSATLRLKTLLTSSGSETYELYNVSTPISSLLAGGSGRSDVFDDLRDGTIYATCALSESRPELLDIPLNAAFVNNANNAPDHRIAIGGALTTLGSSLTNEYLFRNNSSPRQLTDVQLIVTKVPEPTIFSLLLMAAASIITWTRARRFRTNR